MDLDKLQVNPTLRSGWQAVDLGLLMARAWWRPLFAATLLPMLPLTLVLLVVFAERPFWALFIVWWLLPFWERLPLFLASRLLFGESPALFASLRGLPLRDFLPWLLWRRFSVQRAFDSPVTVLEELRGGRRLSRLRVLHGKYGDVAFGTQFVCFCCELIVCFGLVILLGFFTPDDLGIRLTDSYGELSLAGEWIYTVAALVAIVLVLPFHTMAGFSLYLNRRIELEAWDIEISFRNLAQRRRNAGAAAAGLAASLVLVVLTVLPAPGPAAAATVQHDKASAAGLIEEVLNGPDFGQERVVRKWRFRDWNGEGDERFPQWLIDFVEWWEKNVGWHTDFAGIVAWLKIMLVAVFAGLLLYLVYRYRGPLARIGRSAPAEAAPEVLFGLDVTPQSLPDDVPGEVQKLWGGGDYRAALGLLYRASLSRLIARHEIAFRASHTEAECAALVDQRGIASLSEYFSRLTDVWRRLAYGHRVPPGETVQALCRDWSRELGDETT